MLCLVALVMLAVSGRFALAWRDISERFDKLIAAAAHSVTVKVICWFPVPVHGKQLSTTLAPLLFAVPVHKNGEHSVAAAVTLHVDV
jgi:hypothetical protein